ncbi:MAG: hypothetical protein L0Y38_12315, partial [Methylococcaceae bacterium]|nr:hypothetical protein [Methylococcaceae bacterium]
ARRSTAPAIRFPELGPRFLQDKIPIRVCGLLKRCGAAWKRMNMTTLPDRLVNGTSGQEDQEDY